MALGGGPFGVGPRSSLALRASISLRSLCLALLLVSLAVCCGCGQGFQRSYGQRNAPDGSGSVNGTVVLARMFQGAGHNVVSSRRLSPRLSEQADCIVWFPDDFLPPSDETRQWLEEWLYEQPGRTLIYVGRDFDAAAWYWDKIDQDVPDEQRKELLARRASDKVDFLARRRTIPKSSDCQWFTVEEEHRPMKVTTLDGQAQWLEGIDPAKLEIELNGRMLPSQYAEVLLHSEGHMLVSYEEFDESQLIVVSNGSFLLNLPLVNHEHRKLAGKLIDTVGPSGQKVVFLESGSGGPTIHETEPLPDIRTGMEIFNVWPTNWILMHLAVLGIIFCFSRAPIFGIPRSPKAQGTSDFGKHVEAVGELLERSGDEAFAAAKLQHYEQLPQSDG
jgi:hypothetical protein